MVRRHFGNKVTARVETMQYPEDIQISAGYYGNLDILVAKPIQTKHLHLFFLVAPIAILTQQSRTGRGYGNREDRLHHRPGGRGGLPRGAGQRRPQLLRTQP